MAVRRASSAVPLSVGRYQLTGKVGTGPLGIVYRARDGSSDDLVTVQMISSDQGSGEDLRECLTAEFRSAAQLEHPNILRVLDFGQEGEYWYLVSEWVEGISLARMIEAHSRLPEETAIRIITQIGQAMDYARLANRCPWRISPTNILVRNDGIAKLVAFDPASGGVGSVDGDPMKTSAPGSLRKPTNLSFAQAIHSLGTTLYEAVTGIPWVDPSTLPPLPIKKGRTRPPKRKPAIGLTERIDQAVNVATNPDPAKRPTSCADWLKLLRARARSAATPRADMRPMTDDASDRRAFVRYAVGVGSSCTINTSLFDTVSLEDNAESAVWPLVVRDVSAGGIGVLLARRCEPGTELSVELVNATNRVTRSLPVRVVRVRKDTLGHWIHGCEFFTPLDQQELTSVLGYLGRVDPS